MQSETYGGAIWRIDGQCLGCGEDIGESGSSVRSQYSSVVPRLCHRPVVIRWGGTPSQGELLQGTSIAVFHLLSTLTELGWLLFNAGQCNNTENFVLLFIGVPRV